MFQKSIVLCLGSQRFECLSALFAIPTSSTFQFLSLSLVLTLSKKKISIYQSINLSVFLILDSLSCFPLIVLNTGRIIIIPTAEKPSNSLARSSLSTRRISMKLRAISCYLTILEWSLMANKKEKCSCICIHIYIHIFGYILSHVLVKSREGELERNGKHWNWKILYINPYIRESKLYTNI